MKVDITIPSLGESVNEAIIGTILKTSGSQVKIDEEILELETDKVNQVLYAPGTGQLTLNVKQEDRVKIGQVIGYVDTDIKTQTEPGPVLKVLLLQKLQLRFNLNHLSKVQLCQMSFNRILMRPLPVKWPQNL